MKKRKEHLAGGSNPQGAEQHGAPRHRPGEWSVTPDDEYFVVGDEPGNIYASVAHVWEEPHARLMAAAPDLLEALEDITRLVEKYPDYFKAHEANMGAYLDNARAAIQKAKS